MQVTPDHSPTLRLVRNASSRGGVLQLDPGAARARGGGVGDPNSAPPGAAPERGGGDADRRAGVDVARARRR
eukprot:8928617-Pyramimonas_sp.AAC.1